MHSHPSCCHSQLGLGVGTATQPLPTRLAPLPSPVTSVAAGWEHSLLLTASGEVYSFGRGGSGRLGHGDEVGRATPTLVSALRPVRDTRVAAMKPP